MTTYLIVRIVHVSYDSLFIYIFIYIYSTYEGMLFVTFVRELLYPKGNNALKDEGHFMFNILYVALLLSRSI
jgi:hypothetical protein